MRQAAGWLPAGLPYAYRSSHGPYARGRLRCGLPGVNSWGTAGEMQVAVVSVLAKALCGGALVLAFAALSEALKPKRFAGILGAAPSVAIAGIVVGSPRRVRWIRRPRPGR